MSVSPEKSKLSWFWPLSAIAVPLVSLITKTKRLGELPKDGAYVLAPNHMSEFDPLIVAVSVWRMGRAPRFMAKASLFKVPVLGRILRVTQMIPVQRESTSLGARQTLDAAENLAATGRGVIVYPEGTLTRDPDLWPMRGKTGAVRLALEAGVPLIPAAHWGSEKIMPRYGKFSLWPLRKKSVFLVGEAIDLSAYEGRERDSRALAEATTLLMNEITALVEKLRNEKAPAERWDPSKHNQKETGNYES
ncbi:lysophospholipid acyltransferase family protein [Microbacterium sp. YY-03]|uniref:lysophospholipid acyltransferase family protein n=1 Tax=Microbacterium sp. YY-03 TaxID=3421636 RepID=UPI003D17A9FD